MADNKKQNLFTYKTIKPEFPSIKYLLLFMIALQVKSEKSCIFYFPEHELVFNLQSLSHYTKKSKHIPAYFKVEKTQVNVPGEYLVNLCQDQEITKICQPKDSEKVFSSQGLLFLLSSLCYNSILQPFA